MVQDIAPPLTRQLEISRHQAVAAPTLLDDGTLAPSHVTQVLTQEGVVGRHTGSFPRTSPCGRFSCTSFRPMAPAERRSAACALG